MTRSAAGPVPAPVAAERSGTTRQRSDSGVREGRRRCVSRIGRSMLCVALAFAFALVVSAPAFAQMVIDPDCDGSPYPNQFQIYGFYVDTPDSHMSGDTSGVVSRGLACGTEFEWDYYGYECAASGTLNVRLELRLPPGVQINPTAGLPDGSYAGVAPGRAVMCADGGGTGIVAGTATIRTVQDPAGTDCPADAVACYRGTAYYSGYEGFSYTWVEEDEGGAYTMITGPMRAYTPYFYGAGFTQFGAQLCRYAGTPAGTSCGDSSQPWLGRTGDASVPFCLNGKGKFRAVVSNAFGQTTNPVYSCVQWWPSPATVTDSACDPYQNEFGVHDFSVDTPDSRYAYAISGVEAEALVCGGELTNGSGSYDDNGADSLTASIDIEMAPGVTVNPGAALPDGGYAGSAELNVLTWEGFTYYPRLFPDVPVKITVDQGAATDCPQAAVACFKGIAAGGSLDGHLWLWIVESEGGFTLKLGEFHNETYSSSPAGLSRIANLRLCGHLGQPGSAGCGAPGAPWLLKNGLPSAGFKVSRSSASLNCLVGTSSNGCIESLTCVADAASDSCTVPAGRTGSCSGGNGIYSATATSRGGDTTALASYCVVWWPAPPPYGPGS